MTGKRVLPLYVNEGGILGVSLMASWGGWKSLLHSSPLPHLLMRSLSQDHPGTALLLWRRQGQNSWLDCDCSQMPSPLHPPTTVREMYQSAKFVSRLKNIRLGDGVIVQWHKCLLGKQKVLCFLSSPKKKKKKKISKHVTSEGGTKEKQRKSKEKEETKRDSSKSSHWTLSKYNLGLGPAQWSKGQKFDLMLWQTHWQSWLSLSLNFCWFVTALKN